MKTLRVSTMTAMALGASLLLSACGDKDTPATEAEARVDRIESHAEKTAEAATRSTLADDYLAEMDKIATALEQIKDEATAASAAESIAEASTTLQALTEKFDGKVSGMGMAAMMMANSDEFMNVQMRIANASSALMQNHPELLDTIGEVMDTMYPPSGPADAE